MGTVQVRYTLPMYRTVPCTQIAAEIAADLLLFLLLFGYMVHRYGWYGTWVGYTVPVPYLYRTRTIPAYRTCTCTQTRTNRQVPVKLLSKNPFALHVMKPVDSIENIVFIALQISIVSCESSFSLR